MKGKILIIEFLIILAACLIAPYAHAEEPTIVREIQFTPCGGDSLYIFVLSDGSLAFFSLDAVQDKPEITKVFLQLLRKAESESKGKAVNFRQKCEEEGVAT